ncbi:hypothetical protein PC9H_001608 [Pleurotus ostreatus]|uniref:Uncharacterized protein n=1 Tax=Pleurotus ostreatus TaxID=5322 RepID=A0A8H7DWC9_PLEOS|nr:uncharacterized protein PC9H_001608 [Pleurotus ostreatus]KAF7441259.1 hypothetical protein PC9H_001608 [Pleurotus ostreatus]
MTRDIQGTPTAIRRLFPPLRSLAPPLSQSSSFLSACINHPTRRVTSDPLPLPLNISPSLSACPQPTPSLKRSVLVADSNPLSVTHAPSPRPFVDCPPSLQLRDTTQDRFLDYPIPTSSTAPNTQPRIDHVLNHSPTPNPPSNAQPLMNEPDGETQRGKGEMSAEISKARPRAALLALQRRYVNKVPQTQNANESQTMKGAVSIPSHLILPHPISSHPIPVWCQVPTPTPSCFPAQSRDDGGEANTPKRERNRKAAKGEVGIRDTRNEKWARGMGANVNRFKGNRVNAGADATGKCKGREMGNVGGTTDFHYVRRPYMHARRTHAWTRYWTRLRTAEAPSGDTTNGDERRKKEGERQTEMRTQRRDGKEKEKESVRERLRTARERVSRADTNANEHEREH